jgi:hypothetical protein
MLGPSDTHLENREGATWEYRKSALPSSVRWKLSGETALASRDAFGKTPSFHLFWRKFAVRQGFWARQVIQSAIQAKMKSKKDGKSSTIPERFEGENRGVF